MPPPSFSAMLTHDQPVNSVSPAAQIQQGDGAAAAVQQGLQRGAQQAADHPAGGEVPDIIGVNRRQTTGGQDQG